MQKRRGGFFLCVKAFNVPNRAMLLTDVIIKGIDTPKTAASFLHAFLLSFTVYDARVIGKRQNFKEKRAKTTRRCLGVCRPLQNDIKICCIVETPFEQ